MFLNMSAFSGLGLTHTDFGKQADHNAEVRRIDDLVFGSFADKPLSPEEKKIVEDATNRSISADGLLPAGTAQKIAKELQEYRNQNTPHTASAFALSPQQTAIDVELRTTSGWIKFLRDKRDKTGLNVAEAKKLKEMEDRATAASKAQMELNSAMDAARRQQGNIPQADMTSYGTGVQVGGRTYSQPRPVTGVTAEQQKSFWDMVDTPVFESPQATTSRGFPVTKPLGTLWDRIFGAKPEPASQLDLWSRPISAPPPSPISSGASDLARRLTSATTSRPTEDSLDRIRRESEERMRKLKEEQAKRAATPIRVPVVTTPPPPPRPVTQTGTDWSKLAAQGVWSPTPQTPPTILTRPEYYQTVPIQQATRPGPPATQIYSVPDGVDDIQPYFVPAGGSRPITGDQTVNPYTEAQVQQVRQAQAQAQAQQIYTQATQQAQQASQAQVYRPSTPTLHQVALQQAAARSLQTQARLF